MNVWPAERGTPMGKFDGVLLLSDFDDTYVGLDGCVPARNLQALDYFRGEGGRFTIATGRSHRTFTPQLGRMPLDAPVVLSNGSALYDYREDRMLVQTYLPDSAPEDFAWLLNELPQLALETYHGDDIYVCRPNAYSQAHLVKVGCGCTVCPPEEIPTPWTKAIFHQERQVLLQARRLLLDRVGTERYEAIFSNAVYLEMTARGSTKGGMVAHMLQYTGGPAEHLYCVGDNQNDIPMLERSAIPFAPANCAREVRDWGARVLCSCDEGVIGDIVDILDGIYR